jgi:hypothetical protein
MMEQTGARRYSADRMSFIALAVIREKKKEENRNIDVRMVTTYLGPEDTVQER